MSNQEEDATELQFPKGFEEEDDDDDGNWQLMMGSLKNSHGKCSNCLSSLPESYITCYSCNADLGLGACDVKICFQCFSRGAEFGNHRSYHDYMVTHQNFSLFEKGWTAAQEMRLLQLMMQCGLGNWVDISKGISGKSADECRSHFLKCYVNSPCEYIALFAPQICATDSVPRPIPFVGGTDDPPRPDPNSVLYRDLAGYDAARGDFAVEYNNEAESLIQDIDATLFDDDDEPSLGRNLQITVVDIYRWCLGERLLRKRIIRNHGLISTSKAALTLSRYRSVMPPKLMDLVPKLFQLYNSHELNYLAEGLRNEKSLKDKILFLKELRMSGIKKQRNVPLFEALKKRREVHVKEKRRVLFSLINPKEGIKVEDVGRLGGVSGAYLCKRVSVPLNIVGKPGYDQLNESERNIAAVARIYPENFLKYKFTLIEECQKQNGLRLVQARGLIKIDVNKVRKIYDYLLSEDLIYLPDQK